MGYIKSASAVAQANGVTAGGSSSVDNQPKFLAMLAGSTARIARMLETPLDRAGYLDVFELHARFVQKNEQFRLTAGFVVPDSVEITDPSGRPLNSDEYGLRADVGVVTVFSPLHGRYKVQYNAGFVSNDEQHPILQDTPEWMHALADQAGLLWLRHSTMNPTASENVSFGDVMNMVYRELSGSARGHYERPRSPAHWPLTSTVGPAHGDS